MPAGVCSEAYGVRAEAAGRRWRAYFDATGARFRDQLSALVTGLGSTDPAGHTLSLVAWADGLMFSCVARSFGSEAASPEEVRAGPRELPAGMLGD